MNSNCTLKFEKAQLKYLSEVTLWLDQPHVQEFWDNSPEHKQDILIFMTGRKDVSPYFEGIFDYWIGSINNEPFCLLMTSEISIHASDLSYLWKSHLSTSGKTCSLDFMIGNLKFLGKGLGGITLDAFCKFMQKENDQQIDTFIIDPAESNFKAKHVYEKGGFRVVGDFYRDFGLEKNVKHLLMVKHLSN